MKDAFDGLHQMALEVGENIDRLVKENAELRCYVERLREAIVNNLSAIDDQDDESVWELSCIVNQTPAQSLYELKHRVEEETIEGFSNLGIWSWLSAALDDSYVCEEMKRDINEAFEFLGLRKYPNQPEAGTVEEGE